MRIYRPALPVVGALTLNGLALLRRKHHVLGWASLAAGLALAYFYRDPERHPSGYVAVAVAPADGRVVVVRKTEEPEWLQGPAWWVGIFMSLLDVHINRVPVSAWVRHIACAEGAYAPAFREDIIHTNTRCLYYLEDETEHRYLVIQSAGLVARRIQPFVEEGRFVLRGQRLGLIHFGSRVDVFFPADARVLVEEGHRVRAGETPLAYLPWLEGRA